MPLYIECYNNWILFIKAFHGSLKHGNKTAFFPLYEFTAADNKPKSSLAMNFH